MEVAQSGAVLEAPPRAQLAKFTWNAKIWIGDESEKGLKRRARAENTKAMQVGERGLIERHQQREFRSWTALSASGRGASALLR